MSVYAISFLEQPTQEAIRVFAEKRNLAEHFSKSYSHPQEDYLLASEEASIFVVSDGVTLNFQKFIEDAREYPNPSPAGIVAKLFCESILVHAQNEYQNFTEATSKTVFRKANEAVATYTRHMGQTDFSGNPTGFYAATGAFVVLKDAKVYWASICDSFVAHFDKTMKLKYMSSGKCHPYAVINGEDRMVDFLESGIGDVETNDKIFVFTDGFYHYVQNETFLKLFIDWNDSLRERVNHFSSTMNLVDSEKYGHERSLIAIVA